MFRLTGMSDMVEPSLALRAPLSQLLLLVLPTLLVLLPATVADAVIDVDDMPQYFCGTRLSNELAVVCNGSYASLMSMFYGTCTHACVCARACDRARPLTVQTVCSGRA